MAKKRKQRARPQGSRRPATAPSTSPVDHDEELDHERPTDASSGARTASSGARTASADARTVSSGARTASSGARTASSDARTTGKGRKRRRGDLGKRETSTPRPASDDKRARAAAPVPEARVRAMRIHEPAQPAFWFGFEISWAKLAIARVVLFGLLAIDAVLQIAHAPRYGAGDFNVGHLPVFEQLAPGRVGYGLGQLASSYLFVLAMFGVATRWVVPLGAALYAWLYFGSQLDSYQHHYLVAIVLGIASFVPWSRPADAVPSTYVRSWALRLLLIQLAIVYLWAAISKLDGAWIDGTTLGKQMTGSVRAFIDRTIGIEVASFAVIVVELALAATIWSPRLWKFAAPIGIVFHLGIASTGLEIGLFAYLMLGFYILVVPDELWIAIAESSPGRRIRVALARVTASRNIAVFAGLVALGGGGAMLLRFEHGPLTAIVAVAVAFAIGHARRRGGAIVVVGAAHLFAIALWLVVDLGAGVARDYYRFWGGSQRRLGNLEVAERAYRSLLEIEPDDPTGHFQLGRILLDDVAPRPEAGAPPAAEPDAAKAARHARGLAAIHEAQRLEPSRARAWLVEARWLARRGQIDEAQAKARQAVAVDPSDGDARTLLKSLLQSRTATPEPR